MRILHLLASPYWSGPMENVALLALAQRELGHEVTIAIDRRRTAASAEELAAPRLQHLGLLDEGGLELSVKSSLWQLWRDARTLARRQCDVVHCHFTHDHYIARLGRPQGARLIRSIHAPRSLRWSLPAADAYTLPSESHARQLLGRRLNILPPLVDPAFQPATSRAAPRKMLGVEGKPLVGMVSTFQPSRRHDVGIAAFAVLLRQQPEARLVLVGDGALEASIRAQVAAAGLEHAVTFVGYQRREAFVRWLQALDVVWLLGLGNDWSGRAAVQARACDVRVVAVDEGALATMADELVSLAPEEIAAATQRVSAREQPRPSNLDIARGVLKLYGVEDTPAQARLFSSAGH